MSDQTTGLTTELTWRQTAQGDVPISTQFDDPYYSLDNGLAETRHVFLDGNALPARFGDHLHIAELGFGTGLNADAAQTALAAFPELSDFAAPLLAAWDAAMREPTQIATGVTLEVITGDVRQTLPAWQGHADAWFLDGFSPAKNPQMWESAVMHAVADHTPLLVFRSLRHRHRTPPSGINQSSRRHDTTDLASHTRPSAVA